METVTAASSFFDPACKGPIQAQAISQANTATSVEHAREGAVPDSDTISVSQDALLLTEALQAAQNAPDVRTDMVEEIRARLANGTYQLDAKRIAMGLLREDPGLFRL